jgi:hypothetical protein
MNQSPSIFALVFENVSLLNSAVIEFIRSLVTLQTITYYSLSDPTLYEVKKLQPFIVIVTACSIIDFSSSFLSQFFPLSLSNFSLSTQLYVFTEIATYFEINPLIIPISLDFIECYFSQFYYLQLLDMLVIKTQFSQDFETQELGYFFLLYHEMYLLLGHRIKEFKQFQQFCCSIFDNSILTKVISQPNSATIGFCSPLIETNDDLTHYSSTFSLRSLFM